MILYLVKSSLCLGLLLVVYHLFLEREKMHYFNRFYLLFALVFGLFVPFINVDLNIDYKPDVSENIAYVIPSFFEESARPVPITDLTSTSEEITNPIPYTSSSQTTVTTGAGFSTSDFLIGIYFLGVIFFGGRSLFALFSLLFKAKHSETKTYGKATLVLVEKNIIPHSFLRWIFLNKKAYVKEQIEQEILTHEMVHVTEKHSLDVLIIEFLKNVFWFNPIFLLYKRAILLNHEFIADQVTGKTVAVLNTYKNLLLKYAGNHSFQVIASNLGYRLTKQRLIMISKEKNTTRCIIKKMSLIPIITISLFFFSETTEATLIPEIENISEIIVLDTEQTDSPYYNRYMERFETYQNTYRGYEEGEKSIRDVLYQRVRLVWLHQRLTPEEQNMYLVPDLPEQFLTNVTLTQKEKEYQTKLENYKQLRSAYNELPVDSDDILYSNYNQLKKLHDDLNYYSRIFIVDNLPTELGKYHAAIQMEQMTGKKVRSPFQVTLSEQNDTLPLHYLDKNGNVVTTTTGKLAEEEIEYLTNYTKKSLVTQVYPLPDMRKPSSKDIEKWLDDYYYQIWLDGEIIKNEQLMEMSMEKIHHFRIHEVRWNANRRVPYDYQILMYTHEAFEEMVEKYRPSKGMIPFHESILVR